MSRTRFARRRVPWVALREPEGEMDGETAGGSGRADGCAANIKTRHSSRRASPPLTDCRRAGDLRHDRRDDVRQVHATCPRPRRQGKSVRQHRNGNAFDVFGCDEIAGIHDRAGARYEYQTLRAARRGADLDRAVTPSPGTSSKARGRRQELWPTPARGRRPCRPVVGVYGLSLS